MSYYPTHSTVRHKQTGEVMVIIDHYGDAFNGDEGVFRTDLIGNVLKHEIEPLEVREFYNSLVNQNPTERMIQEYSRILGHHFRDRSNIPVNTYDSGHSWYYHLGGRIFEPDEIGDDMACDNIVAIPKTTEKLQLVRARYLEDMNRDIEAYQFAVHSLDRGNIHSCTSISLKFCHIFYNKSVVRYLDAHCGVQSKLF